MLSVEIEAHRFDCDPQRKMRKKNSVFGLRNEVVYYFLTPHFLVYFVECNELINHHFIFID